MNPRWKIDVGDVKVSIGLAHSPNQERQEHSEGSSDQAAGNCEGDAQVEAEPSAAPPNEVVSSSSTHVNGDILKEDCLDDANLLRRSVSVEAQEAASFDEETSTRLKVEEEKKPIPSSSGDIGQIAQDEYEHSGKKTICGDLGKMIAHDEDGRYSDKIGAPAIEDHKQGRGGAGEHVQALLDMDDDTVLDNISYYLDQLKFDPPDDCGYFPLSPYEPQQLTEVYEQLALYRVRGYQHYSSTDFYAEGYFQYYEESLEWYFDPELSEKPHFDNYQSLVLYDIGEYRDWDRYHSTLNTYDKDMAYVQYCEALANETKWIEDHLEHSNYEEHIWSILFDNSYYARMDCVYFEIWKRVAKLKKEFKEVLLELHRENIVPLRTLEIEYELNDVPRRFYMKDDYDAYVAVIDETASDDQARQLIMEAVVKMKPKPKVYLDYIKEKVDIAKDIWLIGKAPP
ncbi:hypothetical protein EJB05_00430, partial [Eragrostis curvula]